MLAPAVQAIHPQLLPAASLLLEILGHIP